MVLHPDKIEELRLDAEQEIKDTKFWEWFGYNKEMLYKGFLEEHCLDQEFIDYCQAEHKLSDEEELRLRLNSAKH